MTTPKTFRTVSFAAAILVLMSASVFAHHGTNISYDHDKPVTLKGTITEFVFSNPSEPATPLWNGLLIGTYIVLYQTVLWTLDSLRSASSPRCACRLYFTLLSTFSTEEE